MLRPHLSCRQSPPHPAPVLARAPLLLRRSLARQNLLNPRTLLTPDYRIQDA